MTYRLTVTRLALDAHGGNPPGMTERSTRSRLSAREARAAVRQIVSAVRHGATVDAATRTGPTHPWTYLARGRADTLLAAAYDTWPDHVSYCVHHTRHTADGSTPMQTRVLLEPSADTIGW